MTDVPIMIVGSRRLFQSGCFGRTVLSSGSTSRLVDDYAHDGVTVLDQPIFGLVGGNRIRLTFVHVPKEAMPPRLGRQLSSL